MKFTLSFCILFQVVAFPFTSISQEKSNVKYGKISPQDFIINSPAIDSSTEAVVISDIGSAEFVGNRNSSFSIIFKRFTRILIRDKKGIDAATIEIPLYVDGSKEEFIESIKGHTYNLENGKIVETPLDKNSIFKEKLNKHYNIQKFTMPAVKPGSIIEYTYSTQSEFIVNLQPWEFQGRYPRIWSEYKVEIPEYLHYVFLSQGSKDFLINNKTTETRKWQISFGAKTTSAIETESLDGQVNIDKWVMKDLRALKEESFTSTIENHISKIQFQLAYVEFPNSKVIPVMISWDKAMSQLMENENFGSTLNHPNNWLDDEVKSIIKGETNPTEKAKLIFKYVKNNFTATSQSGLFLNDNLRNILKNKHGNVAEINLMLINMLQHEKIKAYPVILSTKSHGYTNKLYPIIEKFNYVICYAEIDNKPIYLDASNPSLGFGQLPWECYNGHSRLVDPNNPKAIMLEADSLKESKITTINIGDSEKSELEGNINTTFGTYESLKIKNLVFSKGEDEYFKNIQNSYVSDIKIYNTGIDSLKVESEPLNIHYDFKLPTNKDEELIYLNPIMGLGYKENPLKSSDRKYPVEMPYGIDETIMIFISVPKGYILDEIPKSGKALFNDTEGYFEYVVSQFSDESYQIRCKLKLDRANFQPEEYQSLREFYAYVVKKHSEPIVFRKKA